MLNCQDRETARGRASYVEVEENEADLMRYHDWMAEIAAQDYFGAPRGEAARSERARAEQVFAAFEAAALAAEEPAPSATPLGPDELGPGRLRAVETDL
jgi:hypothetical protein